MVCIDMFPQYNYTITFETKHQTFYQPCFLVENHKKHWIIRTYNIVHQVWDIHMHF